MGEETYNDSPFNVGIPSRARRLFEPVPDAKSGRGQTGESSLFDQVSNSLFNLLSSGIAPNPGSTPTYMIDGVNLPPQLAQAVLSSGAGNQCPNNYCQPGIQNQPLGWFVPQYVGKGQLLFECNGTISDPGCYPTQYTMQFIAGPSDVPFDPFLHSAAQYGLQQYYWEQTHPGNPVINQLTWNFFNDVSDGCDFMAWYGLGMSVVALPGPAEAMGLTEGSAAWGFGVYGVGLAGAGVACTSF